VALHLPLESKGLRSCSLLRLPVNFTSEVFAVIQYINQRVAVYNADKFLMHF